MNKQDKLKALLKDFSKAELIEFLIDDTEGEEKVSEPEPEQVEEDDAEERTHEINKKRRRGKGGRKRRGKGKRSAKGRKKGNSKGSNCRTAPIDIDSPRENKFLDFMRSTNLSPKEREELENAASSDKKDAIPARTTNPRQSSVIEVECRVCGDVYDVSPSVVHDSSRWKCNGCSTSAG